MRNPTTNLFSNNHTGSDSNKLQVSESVFRDVFEFSTIGMALVSAEGKLLKVNSQFCNLLGYDEVELLILGYNNIIHAEDTTNPPVFPLDESLSFHNTDKNYRCKNGDIIQINELFSPVKDDKAKLLYFVLQATGISVVLKAKQSVLSSEERFSLITRATNDAIWEWDMLTDQVHGNKSYYELYNFIPPRLPSSVDFMERIHPDDRSRITEHQATVIGGSAITLSDEFRFQVPDGSYHYFLDRAYVVYDENGKPLKMLGAMIDITEKKKIESELLEAETKFRSLVEKSLAGVYIILEGKFAYVNPRFADIFGYEQAELINTYPVDIVVHPDDRQSVLEKIRARMKGEQDGIHYEANGQRKNGEIIEIEVFGSRTVYNGKPAIIGTLLDISERKRSEREKERARYLLNERIKELTTLYKCSQVFQSEEKSVNEMLQEIVSILPGGWQYPEIAAARIVFEKMEFSTSNYTLGHHQQQAKFITPDGKEGMIEVIYVEERPVEFESAFLAEERDLINMLAEILRVSIARRYEAEVLKKSQANLHTIFDTTDTIYVLLDKELKIISYNQRAIDFAVKELKYELGVRKSLINFFPAERQDVLLDRFSEVLSGKDINYESSYPQTNGSVNWYNVKMFPITSEGKTVYGLMLAVSDITTKKVMEKQILDHNIQQQKKITRAVLKAEESERNKIGRELHDNVNQILVSAKLHIGMITVQNEPGKMDFVQNAINLINSAINEIRSLCKSQVTPLKQIDLEELINGLVEKLDQTTSIVTTFVYKMNDQLIEDDLKINIYRIIQEQINNILKYADASAISILVQTSNKSLYVAVTDDGKGYDTSKKRNGIGISNMINRVGSFNGELLIDSSPGNGCKLEINIPVESTVFQ